MPPVRVEWALCAVLVAGCDVVWSIDHVGDSTVDSNVDSSGDGPDAGPCELAGHDEDHDGVPDATDRCPGIADPDQQDGDDDGVGNACDLSGSTREKLGLFVSFNEPAATWHPLTGGWLPDCESLSYTSVTLNNYGVTVFTGVVPTPPFVYEVHFAIESIDSEPSVFGVLFDANPSSGIGAGCDLDRQQTKDVIRASALAPAPSNEVMLSAMLKPGGDRMITRYNRNGLLECSVRSDDSTIVGTINTPLMQAPPPGTLGFRSFRVGVRVQYFAVYQPN